MQDEIDMIGNDFENLFCFLCVKLCLVGVQQDSFMFEMESEYFVQQGVGMEDYLCIIGFVVGSGGNQLGEIMVQGGNYLLVDQMVGGGWCQLFMGNEFVQVNCIVLGEQQDYVVVGVKDEVVDCLVIWCFFGKQVFCCFGLWVKIVVDKIGDLLGVGKIQIVF